MIIDLYDLHDMLDAATGPSREIDNLIWDALNGCVGPTHGNWTSSIDTAEALRQRLLPDSFIQVKQDAKDVYVAILTGFFGPYGGLNRCAPTEPIARLKALVAALIAKEKNDEA